MSETTKIAHANAGIKAINLEDDRTLRVVATAPTLDRDLEVIDTRSIQVPVKPRGLKYASELTDSDEIDLPFLIDHDWRLEKQAGSVKSMFMNQAGELEVVVKLSTVDNGERVYTLAKEGHLGNSFSIGYSLQNATLEDGVIKNIEMTEFSGVFKGSNRDARLLAVKSIKEEKPMALSQEELKAKQAELAQLTKEIADAEVQETPVAEEVVVEEKPVAETPAAEVPAPEVESEAPANEETEEVVAEEVETKPTKEEETKMSDIKDIAVKQIVPVAELPTQEVKTLKTDKKAVRENFALQIDAIVRKDTKALESLRTSAAEMTGTKAIDGTTGAPLFLSEVVSNDILQEYTNVGRVGSLVDRIDIMGAETYKMLVEAAGTGFQPVALGGVKPEDQPVWTPKSFEPFEWALIVPWLDGVAKRTPIAVYNQLIAYIAREYQKLEDNVVLSYAGGTVGGETRPATGLVPILTTASRVTAVASYSSSDIAIAMGAAYGAVESDGTITIVANRQTWGKLAVAVDGEGRTIFNTVGNQVAAGALGTFNVVVSEKLAEGEVVVGDFTDYLLVTRGGLSTLFSQEATVGSLNLFTQDASALRADVDITGGVKRLESFQLLEFPVAS